MWNQIKRTQLVAAAAIATIGLTQSLQAASITWVGTTSSDFETAANWTGGVVPTNNTTTDTALITGTIGASTNQPSLSISRSVQALQFGSAGWTFSGAAGTTLTVGTTGVFASNTTGSNTVTANIALPTYSTLTATNFGAGGGTAGTSSLLLTGSLTTGTQATPSVTGITFGSTSRRDTVILSPSTGNAVTLYTSTTGGGGLATGTAGTLVLGGTGVNATSSVNTISVASGSSQAAALRYQTGGTLQVNSGTWVANDFGSNNSGTAAGTMQIAGGTLKLGGARYIANAGAVATMTGGTIQVTGSGFIGSNSGYFSIGQQGTGTASFSVSGGTIDVAKGVAGANSQIGGTATGLLNQSGGTVTYGVTGPTNVFTGASVTAGATGGDLVIGSTTAGVGGAYTLTGGTLTVAGTIRGNANTGGLTNFNFTGGTLAARAFDATNIGSNAAATFTANQLAASNNVGTLNNYGGTIAPGGVAAAGLTAVTGNYAGNGSTSTLSFDLGGTTAAAAFAGGAGTFDNITVSGNTTLNDVLAVNLLPGYTPTNADSLVILSSTGTLSGAFSNVAFGGTIAVTGGTFDVNKVGNTVVLSNFQAVPEPTAMAVLGLAGAALTTRRRAVR